MNIHNFKKRDLFLFIGLEVSFHGQLGPNQEHHNGKGWWIKVAHFLLAWHRTQGKSARKAYTLQGQHSFDPLPPAGPHCLTAYLVVSGLVISGSNYLGRNFLLELN